MNSRSSAQTIIRELQTNGYYALCPCCDQPIRLKDTSLFYLDNFTPPALELYNKRMEEIQDRKRELKEEKSKITHTSKIGAKSVNIGFILERLAPTLREFRFDRNDCRSLFDPIDYLIFDGLSKQGMVSKLYFIDIKTGDARLKKNQKEIRSLIERKKVEWNTYEIEGGE